MKSITLVLMFLCLAGPSLPHAAFADEAGRPLTLSQAIEAALAHNPQVVAARYQAEAAASRVITARSGLLPQVYLSETFNRTDSPLWAFGTKLNQGIIQSSDFDPQELNTPDAINNFNTSLTMSWNLLDGGRTRIEWQQAQQGRQGAELGRQRVEQQVIALVARSYVGVLLAAENLEVVEQALATSRAHLKLVLDRFAGGLAVKSDVLRAQVRIADLEQQRLLAHSQTLVSTAALNAAMGRENSGPIDDATPLEQCVSPQGELAQWMAQALRQRPDLKQFDLQEAIAKKGVAHAKSGHWPTLALQGNYEINSEDFSDSHDNYAVGAVVRVNLYSGRRISSQTAMAKAQAAQVKAMREGLALAVKVETQRAYYQAHSAWQSIAVASKAVDQAAEGLRIVGNRYAGGLLTIVDLLDAQVALQQAQSRRFRAMRDYKVARIELALATGSIDKNFQ